eukprot:12399235-Karenia_brevis.AAC.1
MAQVTGAEAAQREVTNAVARDMHAMELAERAKRLQNESVEVKIPDVILEEAAREMAVQGLAAVEADSSMGDDEGTSGVPGGKSEKGSMNQMKTGVRQ